MAFTLHRYILKELLKVFILTAFALTLMLSFGSILKPIQDFGVGPGAVIKLLGYFMPITLTFVLPIAAVFASSLVYGRFASDNELDACRASGISLYTLIYPGLILAIGVAISTLFLSFYIVPNYVHRAEKAIKADAKQILFRNLERKGYYQMPAARGSRYRIWADVVIPEKDEIQGVIVAEDKDGQIQRLITAKRANIYFENHKENSDVIIIARDLDRFGDEGQGSSKEFVIANSIGSLLTDNIKFKEIDELHEIRANVMNFKPISRLATDAYMQLSSELLANAISTKLDNKTDPYYELRTDNDKVRIAVTAQKAQARKDRTVELTGKVVVIEHDESLSAAQTYTYQSSRALLQIASDKSTTKLEMVIFDAEWTRKDGTKGLAQRHVVQNLLMPEELQAKLGSDILTSVANMPSILATPSQDLKQMQANIAYRIKLTMANIDTEINLRLVMGIGCITLILIGSGLGIMLKGGHLLTAFGASSVPAAILIVCLMMGKNIATNKAVSVDAGLTLMWAGLVLMAALTVVIYRKLLKT